MQVELNNSKLIMGNFPSSLTGKDVYYTVKRADETIYVSRRKTGVKEYFNGRYGVHIIFDELGDFIIQFDIDGTTLTATDGIRVIQPEDQVEREFEEYNPNRSVKKISIKKSKIGDFNNPDIEKELSFEYNADETVKTMIEVIK